MYVLTVASPGTGRSGTGSFDATSATSTRAVMVASWLGVAGMAGTCVPLARVFQSHVSQAADARQLAIALAAFALRRGDRAESRAEIRAVRRWSHGGPARIEHRLFAAHLSINGGWRLRSTPILASLNSRCISGI